MELVNALVQSMPKRCQVVIDAKRGWIKYQFNQKNLRLIFEWNIRYYNDWMA